MPLPFFFLSFLPLLSPLVRVNLHHVFLNGEKGNEGGKNRTLVEACEPDTTVNLHFHSYPPSPPPLLFALILFLLACHTLDKLEITLSWAENQWWSTPDTHLSWERGGWGWGSGSGKEKNRGQEGSGYVKWERTRRWGKISHPFSEQRPIQLKLDQSTQMCLVSGYYTQHWVARQRQEILLWIQYSLKLLADTTGDLAAEK